MWGSPARTPRGSEGPGMVFLFFDLCYGGRTDACPCSPVFREPLGHGSTALGTQTNEPIPRGSRSTDSMVWGVERCHDSRGVALVAWPPWPFPPILHRVDVHGQRCASEGPKRSTLGPNTEGQMSSKPFPLAPHVC